MALALGWLRGPLYALLWAVSAVLLGLTADRIHFTNTVLGIHESIIVELLVCAILVIIWVPLACSFLIWWYPGLVFEAVGVGILWLMWLVGAAIATSEFPTGVCADSQCSIVTAIIAFAWIGWILLFFALILIFFELSPVWGYGSRTGTAAGRGYRDKPAGGMFGRGVV